MDRTLTVHYLAQWRVTKEDTGHQSPVWYLSIHVLTHMRMNTYMYTQHIQTHSQNKTPHMVQQLRKAHSNGEDMLHHFIDSLLPLPVLPLHREES